MVERTVTVTNRAGLHARPSAMIVQKLKNIKSNVYLEKDNDRINAKSIMGLLTIGAPYGTELKIIAEGEDEQAALDMIVNLFESKFEEA